MVFAMIQSRFSLTETGIDNFQEYRTLLPPNSRYPLSVIRYHSADYDRVLVGHLWKIFHHSSTTSQYAGVGGAN